MKKEIAIIMILIMSFVFFVSAQSSQNLSSIPGDAQQVQKAIKTYSPLNDSGKVDFEKYQPFKTGADKRIDNINLWIAQNTPWLRFIFGMIPKISVLFAIDLYLILFFLLSLVINNIFKSVISEGKARIIGAGLFIIILAIKLPFGISGAIVHIFDVFILPFGMFAIIVAVVIFVLLLIYAPEVLFVIEKVIEKKMEDRAKNETATNRQVLSNVVKEITQDN